MNTSTTPTSRKIPAPRVLPETLAYWQAADKGQLLVKHCTDCGEFHHYPRDICPFCLSANTVWQNASGKGVVYSFSTMGKGAAAYTMALVTLDEGVTLLLGSDAPVSPLDPWRTLAAAVGRARDGREPWHPEQAITATEAIAASTRSRLEVGQPADIVRKA